MNYICVRVEKRQSLKIYFSLFETIVRSLALSLGYCTIAAV